MVDFNKIVFITIILILIKLLWIEAHAILALLAISMKPV